MPLRLSHSQASRFQDCPKSYEYHYIQKIRPTTKSAALFFGTAIDKAMETMLSEGSEKARKTFTDTWNTQDINGSSVSLYDSTQIVYANSDYDPELLLPEDIERIGSLEEVDKIYKQKDAIGFDLLSKEKKVLLNKANWLCLYRKGLAMLSTLEEEVLPNIEKVLATQKLVELVNEEGDSIIGYADLVCKYKGYDKPIIFDLKTSARPYEDDAVLTNPQLALYTFALCEEYKTNLAGFIVLSKQIKKNKTKICSKCGNDGSGKSHKTCDATGADGKRCHGEWVITLDPKAIVQIIVDEVPEKTQAIVMENMAHVEQSIKTGVYTRSFGSCKKQWGLCPYYNLCFKDEMKGLVKEE